MHDILLRLLYDIVDVKDDKIQKESDDQLTELVYKNLKGKRYLIVVDDIWSSKAWNDIKVLFPDDNNGSRITLTTRQEDVADYVNSFEPHHEMHFLNAEESWKLFHETVFRTENCPVELVDVGMRMAKNCQGLPLLIVVIGGLISNLNKTRDYSEYVAENLNSIIAEKDDECTKILTLSYNYLPSHLKACFLYMGIFPENYEIRVSRLVKLWIAEGFVKPHESKPLEEVAEQYLMDLIDRNLILVRQKGNGKIKTCSMHDLLREVCVRMAHEENFFRVKRKHLPTFSKVQTLLRRLSVHDDASYSSDEEDITLKSMSVVRSFIYTGQDETQLHSYYYFGCELLRVLDMIGVELTKFPDEIIQLVNLRYIAIACCDKIPRSISLLGNLQTLIVEDALGIAIELPKEIFNMKQLRHLKLPLASLPPDISSPFHGSDERFCLVNLETLCKVQGLGLTKHTLEKFPNVKKLGIQYNANLWHVYDVHLQKLERLKILFESPTDSTFLKSITCAPGLKKTTLEGGRIGWQNMTIFGSMPNLEVLKLQEFAFMGPVWEPSDAEFPKLKFLLIGETDLEYWRADSVHFPRLEHLILQKCSKLVKIPYGIGEIMTLKMIEIDDSSPSAVKSAKDILEDQRSEGNDFIQLLVRQKKDKLNPEKFLVHQKKDKLNPNIFEVNPIFGVNPNIFGVNPEKFKEVVAEPGLKKVILKVSNINEGSRNKMMKKVSGVKGVESVAFDEKEGRLTVTGHIDPIVIIGKLRKSFQVEILSVGAVSS